MIAKSSIHVVATTVTLVTVALWRAPVLAQAPVPPPWWGQDDDRTTCVTAPFNTAGETPTVAVSPDPNNPPPMVEAGGDAGWIADVAGHQGVMGVQGPGQMGSVVIWVWNGEGDNSEKHVWLQYDSYTNQGAISGPSLTAGPPADSVGFHTPPPDPVDLGGGWSRHWREWTIKPQPFYEEIEFRMGTVPSGGSSAAAVIDNVQVGSHCENPPNPPNGKVCAFNMTEDVWPPDPVYVVCSSPGYEATTWGVAGGYPPEWMPGITDHEGVIGVPPLGVPSDGMVELWVDDLGEPSGLKHVACQFDFYAAEGGVIAWDPPELPPGSLVQNYQEYIYELPNGWQRCLLKLDVSPPPDWEIFRWHIFADEFSGPMAIDSTMVSSGFLFRDNWLEQFEVYDVGTGLHGQNAWKGWQNDPTVDAAVTDDQANGGFNALDVAGASDVVHEFDGHTSDRWAFTAWQYIPSDFESGGVPPDRGSYFILWNTYSDSGPPEEDHKSVQYNFDSNDGMLKVYYGNGMDTVSVPYETDQWAEIKVVVDLDADVAEVYYADALLAAYPWTGGIQGSGIGAREIRAVELFANDSSSIYYDDLSLRMTPVPGDLNCDGLVDFLDVEAFVMRLVDPSGYSIAFSECSNENGDVNTDGSVNGNDIQAFVSLIVAG